MTTLPVAGYVTRPHLDPDTDLDLVVPGVAEIYFYDPGSRTKRRQVNVSPTVAGGKQTSSVPDMRIVRLGLRIFGADRDELDANTQTYFNAFDQVGYRLVLNIGDLDNIVRWDCDDAEWQIDGDGGLDKFRMMATPMRQLWLFTIPVQPDPLVGVF